MRQILALLLMLPVLVGCGKKKCAVPGCQKDANGTYCDEHTAHAGLEGTVEEIYTFAEEERNTK